MDNMDNIDFTMKISPCEGTNHFFVRLTDSEAIFGAMTLQDVHDLLASLGFRFGTSEHFGSFAAKSEEGIRTALIFNTNDDALRVGIGSAELSTRYENSNTDWRISYQKEVNGKPWCSPRAEYKGQPIFCLQS
jgi:hypothetical protein